MIKPRRNFSSNGDRSYDAGVRHYHRPNEKIDENWDDWIGDRMKSPWRGKFEQVLVMFGTLIFGCIVLGAILSIIYFAMGKVLPILGK